jgi:DNA-binding NarL/FixJ family response regulator
VGRGHGATVLPDRGTLTAINQLPQTVPGSPGLVEGAAGRRPPVGRGGVVVAGLVEPLTARELEVLQLPAAGVPNRAIAQQLVVTQETVKKHLSHLFDKLGAVNRTQAVAQARELGLLPSAGTIAC